MGGKSQKTSSEPWKDIQPYLLEGADYASQLFQKGKLAPDNAGLGDVTRQGLSSIANLARDNGVTAGATNALNGVLGAPGYSSTLPTSQPGIRYGRVSGPQNQSYGTLAQPGTPNFQAAQGPSSIGVGGVQGPSAIAFDGVQGPENVGVGSVNGPSNIGVGGVQGPGSFDMAGRLPTGPESYGGIDPNYGIDAVRQNVLETTLPQVAGMFGTGGFSKSSMAQSTAGRAVASALAPYEYDQVNRNQQLGINQFNTEQDRALNYGLSSAGMEADQFNTDENRRLGFDVSERDTRLGQANINQDRRLGFDVNERDTRLGQGNLNNALGLNFRTGERDSALAQSNLNDARAVDFGLNQQGVNLAQANLNDARAVDFSTQQNAALLAQQNLNSDRLNNFGFDLRDRQMAQDNLNDQEQVAFNAQQHAAMLDQLNVNRDVRNNMALATDDRMRDQYNTQQAQQLSALGLAPAINQMQYGDAQNLLGVGQIRDQNRQANMSEASEEAQAYAQIMAQLGGLGQSGSQTPSTLDTLGGIGQLGTNAALAFSLFCDRRLKRDITPFCTWRGVAIYTFRYLWDDVLRVGPMAQEVPERARFKVGDFYAVNMGAI